MSDIYDMAVLSSFHSYYLINSYRRYFICVIWVDRWRDISNISAWCIWWWECAAVIGEVHSNAKIIEDELI